MLRRINFAHQGRVIWTSLSTKGPVTRAANSRAGTAALQVFATRTRRQDQPIRVSGFPYCPSRVSVGDERQAPSLPESRPTLWSPQRDYSDLPTGSKQKRPAGIEGGCNDGCRTVKRTRFRTRLFRRIYLRFADLLLNESSPRLLFLSLSLSQIAPAVGFVHADVGDTLPRSRIHGWHT